MHWVILILGLLFLLTFPAGRKVLLAVTLIIVLGGGGLIYAVQAINANYEKTPERIAQVEAWHEAQLKRDKCAEIKKAEIEKNGGQHFAAFIAGLNEERCLKE